MIKQILLCIVLASLCISDYDDAWPAMKCDPPQFKIVSQIGVNTLEIEAFDNPGSDAMCAHFWWCIRNLFDQIGAGGRVVIVNWTEDNQGPAWIPSMWKEIDFWANGLIPLAHRKFAVKELDEALKFCQGTAGATRP